MKNLYDYEKTQSATVDLPFGAFKNESSPGQQDGTDIIAEHIQDIAYCLFQVLQLAGVVPNSELEDGNNKTQFINALANIGILKHSDKVCYDASVFVWTINGSDFILYRSNKASNTDDLSNAEMWTKILTINNKNKINFHVQTNISSGSGSSMPVFCFNSGPVDESGEPALITLSENTLTLNAPAVCTTAGGETYTISDNISLDISELADGNYNLFYNPETEGLEIYNNKIYIQKSEPAEMQINDIWVDTSVMPYKSYKKISASEKENVKNVPNAVISILSGSGGGVTLKVNSYNYIPYALKTDLDIKTNIDFSNITETAHTVIQAGSRKMLLLTNNYIDIQFNELLTADADGYATVNCENMHDTAQIAAYVFTPDGKTGIGNQHTAGRGTNCQGAMFIPKGNKYRVWANGGNLKYARFYFCETGEK